MTPSPSPSPSQWYDIGCPGCGLPMSVVDDGPNDRTNDDGCGATLVEEAAP